MYQVIQAKQGGDICAHCGRPIRAGSVFVIRPVPYKTGQVAWVFMHIWCDAQRRGATKEKLRGH